MPARSRVSGRGIPPSRLVTVLLVGALLSGGLSSCSGSGEPDGPAGLETTTRSPVGPTLVLRARRALADLDLSALRTRSVARPAASPSAAARPQTGDYATALARTARRLGLTELRWRFAGPATDGSAGSGSSGSGGAAAVLADVTYRLPVDRRAATTRVTVQVAVTGSARVTGVGAAGRRWPTWLAGPVVVRRTPGAVVVVAGRGEAARRTARSYAVLAARALRVVRRVVPARRPLVVEVPATPAALRSALAGQPGEYAGVAAVTTTADAATDGRAPVRVVVDRRAMAPLGRRARRVVLAHEVTHAETGAATARMPLWLLEGFADYVALRDVGLPEARLAGRAVAAARAAGVPRRLPGRAAFAGADADAAYEQAWLACRVLVDRGGEDRLVALYRLVRGGTPTARALREVFATSQPDLNRWWRGRLALLAR